jgi:DNA polymerase-3 subunit delta'
MWREPRSADAPLFPSVVGHEQAQRALRRALDSGHLAHAYLLLGPRHVGKTTLASAVAQGYLCTHQLPTRRPCGACDSCTRMAHGHHPDVRVIAEHATGGEEGRGARDEIGIETVRQAERWLSLAPFLGQGHVLILESAEQLTREAANALLKTLEEPPAGSLLFLIAETEERLLATIVSRCQRLLLRPLPTEQVRRALVERWQVEPQRAEELAQWCQGRLGLAVLALQDPAYRERERERLRLLLEAEESGVLGRLQWAARLAEETAEEPALLEEELTRWQRWWESVLLAQAGLPAGVDEEFREHIERRARTVDRGAIVAFLREIHETRLQWERRVNPLLALEHLALAAPSGSRSGT